MSHEEMRLGRVTRAMEKRIKRLELLVQMLLTERGEALRNNEPDTAITAMRGEGES